jgi:hypothetical protein
LLWSFDCGDAREDIKGLDNGTDGNGVTYSSPDFSGQGKALSLNAELSQYVRLAYSLNLTMNTSFTASMWLLLTGSNWQTFLSDCNEFSSVCIGFSIRSESIYVRTFNWSTGWSNQQVTWDLTNMICQSCWMYLSFVFNNLADMILLYFNGLPLTHGNFSLSRYATIEKNESKMSYFGKGPTTYHLEPFGGLIDQVSISYYIKNASLLLDEATLLCQYNFDTDDIDADSGPNNIEAYNQNVSRSVQKNQSYLLFDLNDSYFQVSNFTLLMSNYYAFSFALWLRPSLEKSDQQNSAISILQLVTKVQEVLSESYVCFLTLYITHIDRGNPYFQVGYAQLNKFTPINYTNITSNTWIHFGLSYSHGSTVYFYINGIPYGPIVDQRFSSLLYNPRLAVTIAGAYFDDTVIIKPRNFEMRKCFAQNPEFNYTQMYGEIDDFKFFARTLTKFEFATLANSTDKIID